MGAYATGLPVFTPAQVAGTVTLATANQPYNLLALIQAQLDPSCPGAGQEVDLQTDVSGPVYVGSPSPLGGVLSATNYGYLLYAGSAPSTAGASRTYRSSFPGNNSPVGNLWVMGTVNNTTLHVEVA